MKNNIFLRIPKGKELIIEKYKEVLHIKLKNKKKQRLKDEFIKKIAK